MTGQPLPPGERQGVLAAAVVFVGGLVTLGAVGLMLLAILRGGA